MAYSSRRESGPTLSAMQIADVGAGSYNAIVGILAAVIHRKTTGEGQYIDISVTDGAIAFNAVYGAIEPQLFSTFCGEIEWQGLIEGGIMPRDMNSVKRQVQNMFKTKTRAEWVEIFSRVDTCVEPVLTLSEALSSNHTKNREMVVEVKLTTGEKIEQITNPIKFSKTKQEYEKAGSPSGTHTKEVFLELGYDEADMLH